MNKNYLKGYRFERRVSAYFRGKGFYAMESRGSKGLFDIIAIPPVESHHYPTQPLLIQAKTGQSSRSKARAAIPNLKEHSPKWHGIPLIAYNQDHKIIIENLNGVNMRFS